MTGYVLINGEKYSVSIFGGIVHSRRKYRGDLTSRKSNLSERRRSERVFDAHDAAVHTSAQSTSISRTKS